MASSVFSANGALSRVVVCLGCIIIVQNVYLHYASHNSFASSSLCTNPTERRAISFADAYCHYHETEADMLSVGGVVFNLVVVNLHIIGATAIIAIVASNKMAAAAAAAEVRQFTPPPSPQRCH